MVDAAGGGAAAVVDASGEGGAAAFDVSGNTGSPLVPQLLSQLMVFVAVVHCWPFLYALPKKREIGKLRV